MYTTIAAVKLQLGQFSTLLTASLTDDNVNSIITEADNTIDGMIASAVTLPFTSVPKLITKISTDIAVRNVWAQKQSKDIPAHVKDDYDNAIKLLRDINKGILKLTAEDPASDTYNNLKYTATARVFGDHI